MATEQKEYVQALELSVKEFDNYDQFLREAINGIDNEIKMLEKQRLLQHEMIRLNNARKASVLKSISDTIAKQ